jgi:hypothetical protein
MKTSFAIERFGRLYWCLLNRNVFIRIWDRGGWHPRESVHSWGRGKNKTEARQDALTRLTNELGRLERLVAELKKAIRIINGGEGTYRIRRAK